MLHSKFPCMSSYSSSDVIDVHEDSDKYIFKKFINAAIYVEKSIKKLGADTNSENMRLKKTKRCTCANELDGCFFHTSMASGDGIKYTRSENQLICDKVGVNDQWNSGNNKLREIRERQRVINTRRIVSACSIRNNRPQLEEDKYFNLQLDKLEEEKSPNFTQSQNEEPKNTECAKKPLEVERYTTQKKIETVFPLPKPPTHSKIDVTGDPEDDGSNSSSPSSSTLTGSTVRRVEIEPKNNTKITLSSMTSCGLSENETVKQWLMRKIEEQNQRKLLKINEKKKKEEERQKILEKERENFKLWLAQKKKIEEQERALFEIQQRQLERIRTAQLERKEVQNREEYDRWLKKKTHEKMVRENLEKMRAMKAKINHDRRVERNEAAFQQWVKSAKNKPTPIPLNRGLDSLRSSVSVTYINPVPWVPNIEPKPASQ